MAHDIDWGLLAYAIEWYKACGFIYIEVPWIVATSINMLTCPDEENLLKIGNSSFSLVGSSEQSFLKLDFDGELPSGKYVACSPCFRNEVVDAWHQRTFMKVELFCNDDMGALHAIIGYAERFFIDAIKNERKTNAKLEKVDTDDGIDIQLNGIEIGSYGIRRLSKNKSWIYGTGLALPRFTQALRVVI